MYIRAASTNVEFDATHNLTKHNVVFEDVHVLGSLSNLIYSATPDSITVQPGIYRASIYGTFNTADGSSFNRAFLRIEDEAGNGFDAGLASFDNDPDNSGTCSAELTMIFAEETALSLAAFAETFSSNPVGCKVRAFAFLEFIGFLEQAEKIV